MHRWGISLILTQISGRAIHSRLKTSAARIHRHWRGAEMRRSRDWSLIRRCASFRATSYEGVTTLGPIFRSDVVVRRRIREVIQHASIGGSAASGMARAQHMCLIAHLSTRVCYVHHLAASVRKAFARAEFSSALCTRSVRGWANTRKFAILGGTGRHLACGSCGLRPAIRHPIERFLTTTPQALVLVYGLVLLSQCP